MMVLTRDQILSANDLPVERVNVPEWGGDVLVSGLTGAQRDTFESELLDSRTDDESVNMVNLRATLIALSVVDEESNPIFSYGDIELLGKKSAIALDRVFAVAQKVSGFNKKDVDELVGN